MMKDSHTTELRELLDRYYAAETTPEQEKRLIELLSAPGLPEEFLPDKEMMEGMASVIPPAGFELRIADRIDALAASESAVTLRKNRNRFPAILRWSAAAAAVLIIAVTAFTHIPSRPTTPTAMTPEETYAQVEMALTVFSEAINKGYAALEQADATTTEATEKAYSALAAVGIGSDNL